MIRSALLLFSMAFFLQSNGQGWDMLLFKRNSKTMTTFMPGARISISDKDGRYADGTIRKIDRDTLFITEYDVRKAYNMWYTSVLDTVSAFLTPIYYKDITKVYRRSSGFEFIRDGTLFMLGGAVYMILHLVNSAIQHQPVQASSMAIAGGVTVAGLMMHKLRKHYYAVGHKYHFEYIRVTGK